MPFRSQAQWQWAFANKKPWASEWAKETPRKFSDLPAYSKKATTTGNFPPLQDKSLEEISVVMHKVNL